MALSNDEADELKALAKRALELVQRAEGVEATSTANTPSQDTPKRITRARPAPARDYTLTYLASVARFIYRYRRRRDEYFECHLFGEMAWDMLLDLFIAAAEGKRISTTSLCLASAGPPTTALRWIGVLEAEGLIVRAPHERDRRATYIELSDSGFDRMKRFLTAEVAGAEEAMPFMLSR